MAGGNKRKTTMAKLTRERRLQERRLDKNARKVARKQAAEHERLHGSDGMSGDLDEAGGVSDGELDLDAVSQAPRED